MPSATDSPGSVSGTARASVSRTASTCAALTCAIPANGPGPSSWIHRHVR